MLTAFPRCHIMWQIFFYPEVGLIFGTSININMTPKKIEVRPVSVKSRQGERNWMAPKIYVHHSNETIIENLQNRRSRPYTTYKKELLPVVMEHIKHSHPHLHDRLKNATWSWDKYCGCSMCPCSPGFVAKGIYEQVDIWVDL